MSTLSDLHELLDHLLEKQSDDVGTVVVQIRFAVDHDAWERTMDLIKRKDRLRLEDSFESDDEVGFIVSVYY